MANSKIDICNQALAMVGAASIRDFVEQTKRARMVEVFYDAKKNYLLSKFDWPFARKFRRIHPPSALDPLDLEEIPEGFYAYQLPVDCKTPRDIYPRGSSIWWEINRDKLFCRTPPEVGVYLYYTSSETDANIFSDTFSDLLALAIAVQIGPSLTQDKKLVATLYQQFVNEQRDAWESDANIGNTHREPDEVPENDSFVNPSGTVYPEPYFRDRDR